MYSYNVKKNEYADLDWDNLGFGLTPTDYMYVMKCSNNGTFEQGQLNRYGNIELNPAAGVLNYGQVSKSPPLFHLTNLIVGFCFDPKRNSWLGLKCKQGLYEGTKAYRKKDGNLILFRPDQNAMRMQFGAERMCMPSPSVDQFIDAVKQTVQANKCWVILVFIFALKLNSFVDKFIYKFTNVCRDKKTGSSTRERVFVY